jgi:hypothetical protein
MIIAILSAVLTACASDSAGALRAARPRETGGAAASPRPTISVRSAPPAREPIVGRTDPSPMIPVTSVVQAPATPDRATNGAGRISWQNGGWYLLGANVPWFNWGCDFGCGGRKGVSSPAVAAQLEPVFRAARDSGVRVLRWWVFPGEPWQITRDGAGAPAGVDEAVYADFDAALRLAAAHDLYFEFTLFSAPTHLPAAWLTDAGQRARLADVLGALFARYAGNPRVLAWDVINEPEWDIWSGDVPQEAVQATVQAIAASVHRNSPALVTVGAARIDGLPLWVGLGLDYYQAHWYDKMNRAKDCARCTDYATLRAQHGLDKPLVIGEFYAGQDADALQRFQDFYAKGYAGAYPWSLFPDHTNDMMTIDLVALAEFARQYADLGPRAPAAGR